MDLGYTDVESAILAILEPVLVEKVRGEASEAPPLTFCSQTRQSATSIETMPSHHVHGNFIRNHISV